MSDDTRKAEERSGEVTPEWHPYSVWQRHIRDSHPGRTEDELDPTGSWRTDAVWQSLIKP